MRFQTEILDRVNMPKARSFITFLQNNQSNASNGSEPIIMNITYNSSKPTLKPSLRPSFVPLEFNPIQSYRNKNWFEFFHMHTKELGVSLLAFILFIACVSIFLRCLSLKKKYQQLDRSDLKEEFQFGLSDSLKASPSKRTYRRLTRERVTRKSKTNQENSRTGTMSPAKRKAYRVSHIELPSTHNRFQPTNLIDIQNIHLDAKELVGNTSKIHIYE